MSFCVSGPALSIVAFSTASLCHLLLFFGVGLVFRFCFLLVLFPSSFSYHSCGCRCFFFHEKNCSGLHMSKIAKAPRCSLLAPLWLPHLRELRSASQCCENLLANISCWLYCCFCNSAFTFRTSCSLCVGILIFALLISILLRPLTVSRIAIVSINFITHHALPFSLTHQCDSFLCPVLWSVSLLFDGKICIIFSTIAVSWLIRPYFLFWTSVCDKKNACIPPMIPPCSAVCRLHMSASPFGVFVISVW